MKNTKIILFSITAGLALYGFYIYDQYKILYKAIENAFEKKPLIKLNDLSINNIKITIIYKILNKGILYADVTEQNYDVSINNKKIATVHNKNKIQLVPNGTTNYPLTVEFNPKDVIKAGVDNIASILVPSQRKNFVFNIKGKFSIRAGIISKKGLPLDTSFTLADVAS